MTATATATKIDLQKFCAPEPTRYRLDRPQTIGDWTYATDAKIGIRVPATEYPCGQEGRMPDNIHDVFSCHNKVASDAQWLTLSGLPPLVFETCESCAGKGSIAKCTDCDGKGEITFEAKSGTRYRPNCRRCDTNGHTPGGDLVCPWCYGAKQVPLGNKFRIGADVAGGQGGKDFDLGYLHKIAELPNATVLLRTVSDGKGISVGQLLFRFDGGVGVLMGLSDGKKDT